MQDRDLLDDALLLIDQNFYFLHVGEFFGTLAKQKPLFGLDLRVNRVFETKEEYTFNNAIIDELLKDAQNSHHEQTTLFEYFVEFSAFRSICMAMVEALRLQTSFRSFIQFRLQDQYENFFDIVSFVRNVLSHNIHAQIRLDEKDYAGTLKRIRRMNRNALVDFDFNYYRDLPEIDAPASDYGFRCNIDFESLEKNMPFLHIISHWKLMMLSELCFNLSMAYRIFSNLEE